MEEYAEQQENSTQELKIKIPAKKKETDKEKKKEDSKPKKE